MIWFTADTHFGHANIIRYCGRPFDTKEEHDQVLIANWNSVVGPKDTVYHLGDFGFGTPEAMLKIAGKLRGQIILLKGNHDGPAIRKPCSGRFTTIKDVHSIRTEVAGTKVEIWLSHYAHRTWPKSHHGSYHLFGHSHANLEPYGKSFDVGVDAWGFTPISIDTVHKKMLELPTVVDHERSKDV